MHEYLADYEQEAAQIDHSIDVDLSERVVQCGHRWELIFNSVHCKEEANRSELEDHAHCGVRACLIGHLHIRYDDDKAEDGDADQPERERVACGRD